MSNRDYEYHSNISKIKKVQFSLLVQKKLKINQHVKLLIIHYIQQVKMEYLLQVLVDYMI